MEIMTELFAELASNPVSIQSFEQRMIPIFMSVMTTDQLAQNPGVISVYFAPLIE
jgi:hypothetical protein